jgi:hypothetical protein
MKSIKNYICLFAILFLFGFARSQEGAITLNPDSLADRQKQDSVIDTAVNQPDMSPKDTVPDTTASEMSPPN